MNEKALEALEIVKFGGVGYTIEEYNNALDIARFALCAPTFEEIVSLIKRMQEQNIIELNLKFADGKPFDHALYYEKDKTFYAIISAVEEMADVDTSEIAKHGNGKFTECDHQSSLRERGKGKI